MNSEFLTELTCDVIEAARVRPGQRVGTSVPNATGGTLIRPGGRQCYPAFWIRDFATGWVCFAIAQVDAPLAKQLAGEFIEELREGDFRKGPEFGSPYECRHPEGDHRQNPVYLTSVTCPLAAFVRQGWILP